jgi:hypothetical protein
MSPSEPICSPHQGGGAVVAVSAMQRGHLRPQVSSVPPVITFGFLRTLDLVATIIGSIRGRHSRGRSRR